MTAPPFDLAIRGVPAPVGPVAPLAEKKIEADHNRSEAPPFTSCPSMSAASIVEIAPTFEAIFREHAPYVWRALRRLGVRDVDLEDMCQDVFLVVHRRLSTFHGGSSIRTWLYGICIRAASDYRRRPHRAREAPAGDELPEVPAAPEQEDIVERSLARDRLDDALDALDEAKRAVFVLYEIEGLLMPEVAEAVGCPLQTAYSRLHAARKIVTDLLTQGQGAARIGAVARRGSPR